MSKEDIELMTDTVMELDMPPSELRMFVLRLPKFVSPDFLSIMRTRHRVEVFG